MNEFTEKNRRLLHFYCETLRTIASVILILQLIAVCAMTIFTLLSKFGHWPVNMAITTFLPSYLKAIFFWIGILGLAQFVRYLYENNYLPGWILRHGDMFFYLYAFLTILEAVWIYMANDHSPPFDIRVHMGFVKVFSIVVKVMALVGLGQILRHLMPVIKESKSLV
ncbi:MAG: hypothetical protein FVQ84_05625 [Planctomycetes bacterium]|nr:hypothetical protein [Planctomycetota bacterium]